MKYIHFSKAFLQAIIRKILFFKKLTVFKINNQINREADNQQKQKHQVHKVALYKNKNKSKKKYSKDGILRKHLNSLEIILRNLRK
jgi:hypothetical protein